MTYSKLRLGLSTFAISGLVFFSAAPMAFAQHGDSTSTSSRGSDSGTTVSSADDSTVHGEPETTEVEASKTGVEDRIHHSETDGKQKLALLRTQKAAKTAEQRQKSCEQRKTSINNRITAYDNAANTKLTQFNTIFERVKKFKTDKALQVSNYDALVATATAKQQAATDAVAALKALSADFDCASTDPGATVASIKSSTVDARTALKEYRKSIKDIVVALAQVNKTSSSDSTATNDDSTTTTTTTTEAN
jgi:hypothetical protein